MRKINNLKKTKKQYINSDTFKKVIAFQFPTLIRFTPKISKKEILNG